MKKILVAITLLSSCLQAYAGAVPVDEMGIPCISIKSNGTELLPSIGANKHNYTIENRCDRSLQVNIETNAGWEGITNVAPATSRNWFCTDGHKANKDCNGGIRSFYVKP